MKLTSRALIEDDGIRHDEKQRQLQRFYRVSGREVRCVASDFALGAAGQAVIVANFPARASTAKRSLPVAKNKAGFVSLTGG